MSPEEVETIVSRLRQGSRLLMSRDLGQGGSEITEIARTEGPLFKREITRFSADANMPSQREKQVCDESEIRQFLMGRAYRQTVDELTRAPKPREHVIDMFDSATLKRPYTVV